MFNRLFRRNKEGADFKVQNPDIHSHLIPGIDDGAATLEDSLALIRKMVELGYSRLITTPHIMWDSYKNTPEIIRQGLEQLREAVEKEGIQVQLEAAAEYFIDEHFLRMLKDGTELLTLPGNRLLVELPYSTPLMNTSETLFSIVEYGYTPILAHPERYTYYHQDLPVYERLAAQGCLLQLNVLSLSNYYGAGVQRAAKWLIKEKLITFLGTDTHHYQHVTALEKALKHPALRNYNFMNHTI